MVVRFPNQGRQPEDIEILTHSNETFATVRRRILTRIKSLNQQSFSHAASGTNSALIQHQIGGQQTLALLHQQAPIKLDLYLNNELLDPSESYRPVSQFPLKDKTVLTAKLSPSSTAVAGSPDSSSDSSVGGSPQHAPSGYAAGSASQQASPSTAASEMMLPGVLMARDKRIHPFLCQIADLGSQLNVAPLRDTARLLIRQLPADPKTSELFASICQSTGSVALSQELGNLFTQSSPSTVLYNLEVINLVFSLSYFI